MDRFANHPIIKDSDIAVTTSSGIHGAPITEWIVMTTLIASRHYAVEYEWQKEHHWGTERRMLNGGTDWVNKTVGIAGYGSIGRQGELLLLQLLTVTIAVHLYSFLLLPPFIPLTHRNSESDSRIYWQLYFPGEPTDESPAARVFSALGARIHAYTASPRPTPSSRADHGYFVPGTGDPDGSLPSAWYSGADKTSLRTFLASGLDALIVAVPLTPSTQHLFGADEFALLASAGGSPKAQAAGQKPFLINIARGAVLDQPALVTALNDGVLGGAALDVTDPEPLPKDDPLWDAKNVIITPHVSSMGIEYRDRAFDLFVTNWKRHERGEKMFNLVDRRKGY